LASETGLDLSDEAIAGSTTLAPETADGDDAAPAQAADGRTPQAGHQEGVRASADAPQPLSQVPLATYLAGREGKQELKRRLEAFEQSIRPPAEPDPFLDPKGFVAANAAALVDSRLSQHIGPVLQQLRGAVFHNNKMMAAALHGAEAVERAQTTFDTALPHLD